MNSTSQRPSDNLAFKRLPNILTDQFRSQIFFALLSWEYETRPTAEKHDLIAYLGRIAGCEEWAIATYISPFTRSHANDLMTMGTRILNQPPSIAALYIARYFNLKAEYCFHSFPETQEESINERSQYVKVHDDLPAELIVNNSLFRLTTADYDYDFRGHKAQAICQYEDATQRFHLVASREKRGREWVITIGSKAANAIFYSRADIARHPNATIILCLDLTVAIHWRRIARESKLLDKEQIIIATCFGDETTINALNFNHLAGHHVVIVPPPANRNALTGVTSWAERCLKGAASRVSIYPWPISSSRTCTANESMNHEQREETLWSQAAYLEDIELISKFSRAVCQKAIPFAGYPNWMQSIGLTEKKQDKAPAMEDTIQFTRLSEIAMTGDSESKHLSLDTLISPSYTTLIWGPSNAGKSWFVVQLSIALTTGLKAFGLPTTLSRRVCYLDGESRGEDFKKRCLQLLKDTPEAQQSAEQNLRVLNQTDLNILAAHSGDDLLAQLRKANTEVLVIDNLLSLAPSAAKSNAEGLFKFIRKVEQAGIAVIIVHHSGKDGETFKGSSDLGSLAKNIIRLEGRDQLKDAESISPSVKEACHAAGPVIRLTVEKCKIGPYIENVPVIYHLPVDKTWQLIEGSWELGNEALPPEEAKREADAQSTPASLEMNDNMSDLSPDEEKVLVALTGKKLKRAELETLTGFKEDKLRNILQKLGRSGFVRQEGTGKGTYYQPA